jgi:hypothetical protein
MIKDSVVNGAVVWNGANGASPLSQGHVVSINGHIPSATPDSLMNMDEADVPKPTANGGFSHTSASRAKIGAANKGKTPWNKGKERSVEVRARIAAGVRAKNRERLLQKLADMGITEEEHEAKKKEERREKDAERRSRRTANGGYRPTDETRAKISKVLKAKFASGEMKPRKVDLSKVRRGFKQSEETRAKISESLKKRWATDPVYREKMKQNVQKQYTNDDVRQKISATLKKKWKDPEFRSQMLDKMSDRQNNYEYDSTHREKISKAMKAKWQNQEYREKSMRSMAKRQEGNEELKRNRPVKKVLPKKQPPKKTQVKGSQGDGVQRLQPLTAGENKKAKKKKKAVRKKKTIRILEKDEDDEVDADGIIVVKAKTKGAKKKPAAKKVEKAKKEPDGSVNRLREERRDLFDLLYGDEDKFADDDDEDDGYNDDNDEEDEERSAAFAIGDEDLDSFDPYGLDDY